ncbi:MAG TPA: hypothetical protein IGS17_15040 [Oscillatoriales cyanobacterium M59_W2019_021]|nr:hypothetical protein [Oscillatoriales cyanobacterium M59_W2019_021]
MSTPPPECLHYQDDLNIPFVHIGNYLERHINVVKKNQKLLMKPWIALGGIVPNLLRAPQAISHSRILENLLHFCQEFKNQKLHVFGIGGTATLHIAALLGIHSVDSSGWRNRAARGLIQLPGTGERVIADLGNWRGRRLSEDEFNQLKNCPCPACRQHGVEGLKASGVVGFSNRATHNLWVLLEEARLIEEHLLARTYKDWYKEHLDNTMYRPLIDRLVETSLSQYAGAIDSRLISLSNCLES